MVVAAKDAELQRLGVELRQAQELLLAAEEAEAERTDRSVRDLQARVDELQARADGTSRTCCASCNMVPATGGGGGGCRGAMQSAAAQQRKPNRCRQCGCEKCNPHNRSCSIEQRLAWCMKNGWMRHWQPDDGIMQDGPRPAKSKLKRCVRCELEQVPCSSC